MSNLDIHRTSVSACLRASRIQPPLPDGSFMIAVNDPVDAIHSERHPEEAVDRHRETMALDRVFWFAVGLLMVTGIAIRIWMIL
ncbi:hypothetical protein Pan97_49630 [Bremerella volcania]|uniref:Uncharacterized protein n=1 Tax=Bremerella volcania TaxID=2527984 RepID=A0A518CFD7_9BACT|nr:hypothetical protein [Bremerella volcania]QDU77884.1 hypothetical protein Pan97_49630 [Bremerella volcania]